MSSNRNKPLRRMVIALLVLLGIQYELGMAVNLSPDLPSLPPFNFSLAQISDALHAAGTVALLHGILGSLLAIISISTLFFSLTSGIKKVQVFGVLGSLTVVLAAASGVLFTLSGFQADYFSTAMASNFLLSFTFYFLELYYLRAAPKTPGKMLE